jgi:hypothetical protein
MKKMYTNLLATLVAISVIGSVCPMEISKGEDNSEKLTDSIIKQIKLGNQASILLNLYDLSDNTLMSDAPKLIITAIKSNDPHAISMILKQLFDSLMYKHYVAENRTHLHLRSVGFFDKPAAPLNSRKTFHQSCLIAAKHDTSKSDDSAEKLNRITIQFNDILGYAKKYGTYFCNGYKSKFSKKIKAECHNALSPKEIEKLMKKDYILSRPHKDKVREDDEETKKLKTKVEQLKKKLDIAAKKSSWCNIL